MAIPTITPPTDNLYKFKAISGVVVTLFCVGVMINQLNEFRRTAREASLALAIESVRLSHAHPEVHEAAATGRLHQDSAIRERRRLIDEERARIDAMVTNHRDDLEQLPWLFGVLGAGTVAGVIMALRGFRDWENHVQAPENRLLQLKLLAMERECGRMSPAAPEQSDQAALTPPDRSPQGTAGVISVPPAQPSPPRP